jgi:hypothetical protein
MSLINSKLVNTLRRTQLIGILLEGANDDLFRPIIEPSSSQSYFHKLSTLSVCARHGIPISLHFL